MRSAVHKALTTLADKEGVTLNNVADEVIKLVPDATHGEVAAALNSRVKDLFEHEDFPSGVHMGQLNTPAKDGSRRHPQDCVV